MGINNAVESRTSGQLWDATEAEYFASDRLSASRIELFRHRRSDYFERVVQGKPEPPPTEAMALGKYEHALVLEPDTCASRFAIAPRRSDLEPELFGTHEGSKLVKRNTKAGKAAWDAFVASVGGLTILLPEQADLAPKMFRALTEHRRACELLFELPGRNEQSILWSDEINGRGMRCRLDRLIGGYGIVELKTDRDIDPTQSANRWRWNDAGYHRKAAIYIDAVYAATGRNLPMFYVFVENNDRPRVSVCRLETDSPAVEQGREEYRKTLADIAECERTGDWREPWEDGEQPYPAVASLGGTEPPLTLTMGGTPMEGFGA